MTATEAYYILQRRQINGDRILAERTSMFLLATAFLFLAFVMLLDSEWEGCIFTILRIAVPSAGILLTILLFSFNQSASIALEFWHKAQRKIEEEATDFDYMRSNDITPHIAGNDFKQGKKEWIRDEDGKLVLVPVTKPKKWWQKRILRSMPTYRYYLPLTFFLLWIAALAVAIICVTS
jgi:hypothetical protein